MMMTEVRIKGEAQHQILPREELGRLLDKGLVEGVFKYALATRGEPGELETRAAYRTDHSGLRAERPTASAIITASSVDRDGDIVRAEGLDVAHYLKNPVVLPMHRVTDDVYPVGMTERMKATRNAWWAKWQWLVDLEPTAKRAAEYMLMWDAGVLNCTSIGFIPTQWEPIKDGAGYDFKGSELLEYSTVFIPSNREALRTEGMKQFLAAAGELITAGPSPLMKGWLAAREAEGRPKQVAVGMDPSGVLVTYTPEERDFALGVVAGDVVLEAEGDDGMKGVADALRGKDAEGPKDAGGKAGQEVAKGYDDAAARKIVAQVKDYMELAALRDYPVSMGVLLGVSEGKPDGCFRTYTPRDAWTLAISVNGGGTRLDRDGDADFRTETWDEVKLACAAGALSTERAFEIIERLMSEQKSGADAARAEAESWKAQCAALSARVVVRG